MLRQTLGVFAAATGRGRPHHGDALRRAAGWQPARVSALGVRSARNAQLVLEREARLDHVGDPARGSFFVESRTDALARAAWTIFQSIEAEGGLASALESGWIADQLATSREALAARIEDGSHAVVGVTQFTPPGDAPTPERRALEGVEADAAARRARRDARGRLVLGSFETFAHGVDAAAQGATLDEIGGAFVRGAPQTLPPLPNFNECATTEGRS